MKKELSTAAALFAFACGIGKKHGNGNASVVVVLLGQLLRASSFPGTLAHEEILPHHHWVDFSTCNRRAVRSPNREQERPEQVKPVCQCTIIAKLNFFYPEKSRTILALHIYYRHTSSRYSLETTHEITLSSVK